MTGLVELDDKALQSITKLDEAANEYSLAKIEQLPPFQRAITLARGMQQMREFMSGKVMDTLMSLNGAKIGFRCDKDNYPPAVIRDALIEGMLRGARPCGNEINVIGGNCYLTKEFYERLLSELEGFDRLRVTEGVPVMQGERGALVPMWASWEWNGQKDELRCMKVGDDDSRIAVRVNAGMGVDAILGKAKRKLYARIYARITGSRWAAVDANADHDDVIDGRVVAPDAPHEDGIVMERDLEDSDQ